MPTPMPTPVPATPTHGACAREAREGFVTDACASGFKPETINLFVALRSTVWHRMGPTLASGSRLGGAKY